MDLAINNDRVKLNPLNKNNLALIKDWYSQMNSYGYATGGKDPEEAIFGQSCSMENCFISGIYPACSDSCIGIVSGELKRTKSSVLWIRSFFIEEKWQRKHFGTYAFQLLSEFFYRYYHTKRAYVSVSVENKTGIAFWKSLYFYCVKIMRLSESEEKGILILEKVIK